MHGGGRRLGGGNHGGGSSGPYGGGDNEDPFGDLLAELGSPFGGGGGYYGGYFGGDYGGTYGGGGYGGGGYGGSGGAAGDDYEALLALDDTVQRCRGLPRGEVDLLPTQRGAPPEPDGSPASCCICMEDMKAADEVMRLPCQHLFHSDCIRQWLQDGQGCCPIDKSRVEVGT